MSITAIEFKTTNNVNITFGANPPTPTVISNTTYPLNISQLAATATITSTDSTLLPKVILSDPLAGYTNQQIVVDCSNLTIDGSDGLGGPNIEIDLNNQTDYSGLISLTNDINTTTTIQNITMNVSNSTLATKCGFICKGGTDNIGGLNISNCNVTSSGDLEIGGGGFYQGGILGGYNDSNTGLISISDCNVTSSGNLTIGGGRGSYQGGILGGYNESNTGLISISDCNVTSSGNLTIGGGGGDGGDDQGGIMGGFNSLNTAPISITNCNVTSNENLTIGGGGGGYQGGILGGENNRNTGPISISDCNVTSSVGNLTIGGGGSYQGGIMGGNNENNTGITLTTCTVSFCNRQNTFSYNGSNVVMPSPPPTKTSVKVTKLQISLSNQQYVIGGVNTSTIITITNVFIINNCYSNNQGISPVLTPTVNGGNERSANRELVRRTAPRIGLLRTFTSYNQEQKPKTKISTQADRIAYLKLKEYNKMYNNTKL